MADITLAEFDLQDASLTVNLPFSRGMRKTFSGDDAEEPPEDDEAGVESGTHEFDTRGNGAKSKGMAVVGVFVFLVIAAAAIKYLSGDDDEPETDDVPPEDEAVGVAVGSDDS